MSLILQSTVDTVAIKRAVETGVGAHQLQQAPGIDQVWLSVDKLRHADLFETVGDVLAAPRFLLEFPIVGQARGDAEVPIERYIEVDVLLYVLLA